MLFGFFPPREVFSIFKLELFKLRVVKALKSQKNYVTYDKIR